MFQAIVILFSSCCVTPLYTSIAIQHILPLRHEGTKYREDFVNLSVFASSWLNNNHFVK
jgi:hypothetical protein